VRKAQLIHAAALGGNALKGSETSREAPFWAFSFGWRRGSWETGSFRTAARCLGYLWRGAEAHERTSRIKRLVLGAWIVKTLKPNL
jgi:hypothetical protein